jgi:peroxiredoxin Q/BCP
MRAAAAACVCLLTVTVALPGATAQTPAAELKPGDVAPAFTLPGSDGTTYSLSDYKGVKPVVLAWFPRAPIKD